MATAKNAIHFASERNHILLLQKLARSYYCNQNTGLSYDKFNVIYTPFTLIIKHVLFQDFKLVLYRDVHTSNKTGVNILKTGFNKTTSLCCFVFVLIKPHSRWLTK